MSEVATKRTRKKADPATLKTLGLWRGPEYQSWAGMRARCNDPNHTMYRYYGGRGITVCEQWATFRSFYGDMGPRPEGMWLDRIDTNGNYEPGNCRWADKRQQRVNQRRVKKWTYNGKTLCLTDWIREITGDPNFQLKFKAAGEAGHD